MSQCPHSRWTPTGTPGVSTCNDCGITGHSDPDWPRNAGWIAVDLDGTLAVYDHWRGADHIGAPIPAMVARVKKWISEGKDVRIFTARVDGGEVAIAAGDPGGHEMRDVDKVRAVIHDWCHEHIGVVLPVTNAKDYGMVELWDDRCIRVVTNTGERCCG